MSEPTPDINDTDLDLPDGLGKDAADAVRLLEWARKRGFSVPVLEIGAVKLRVTDLRQARKEGLAKTDEPADIYTEHLREMEDE